MNIVVSNKFDEDFINKLIAKFIKDIKLQLTATDFTLLDMWIQVEFGFDAEVTCRKIIECALKHIEVVTTQTNYIIQFNPIIYYPGTSTRLITLLKTITYGTRHFKGNLLIIDACKRVNNDLDNLYNQYRLLGVVI